MRSRVPLTLLLLLLQDMEISVFELRTILNRVIARRECCPPSPLFPGAPYCVLMHVSPPPPQTKT